MTNHLPGEGCNTAWFDRLSDFEQKVIRQQIEFKRGKWPNLPDGKWSKNSSCTYPHILPSIALYDGFSSFEEAQRQAFHEDIAGNVLAYCKDNNIALHTDILNLKSSQSVCFNLMFPLRQDYVLASRVLSPLLPDLREVTKIEFEYTFTEVTEWLGEGVATPGKNCTSIDAVVWWDNIAGQKKISLLEWKYTEKGFGGCSSANKKENVTKDFCKQNWSACGVGESCYVAKPRNRRYWDHLQSAGINVDSLCKIIKKGCPFRGQYYQVMRQFLFAEYLRKETAGHDVEILLISFKGNDSFKDEKVITPWNTAIKGKPPLRHVYADDLNKAIQDCSIADKKWQEYLTQRYFP